MGTAIGGRTGYADVFMRGVFAWENKAPGKNLDLALKQLLSYSPALSNSPLLVVSDCLTIRIHTQFTGHPSQVHQVELHELDQLRQTRAAAPQLDSSGQLQAADHQPRHHRKGRPELRHAGRRAAPAWRRAR